MEYKRILRFGMQGADVRFMKECLFALGCYEDTVRQIRKDSFGEDTRQAVLTFQKTHTDTNGRKLDADGIIGPLTWRAVLTAMQALMELTLPNTVGKNAQDAIRADLLRAGGVRRRAVLLALPYAYDPEAGGSSFPLSLYIRGENLFGRDLAPVVITKERIEDGARRQPQYYNGGRKEMMLSAVQRNPKISGADCSGGVVGVLRKLERVKPAFDATANQLCGSQNSRRREKTALQPGDFVGRPEHIGLYAGGGYVIEWIGGAYGCQLTKLDAREAYDFVKKRMSKKSAWTKFREPLFY